MKELGIEPILLLAQIINFGIVVFLLKKLLYKPVLTMLDKRRNEIQKGLELTEKMKSEQEKFEKKRETLLDEARKQAKVIIEDAKKQGKEKEKEIVELAHKEAGEVLARTQKQVEELHEQARKKAKAEAIDLSIEMIKKVLPGILKESDHRKLLAGQLTELSKVK
jgi:F-type H+-transporting ATPase subunit b